jgi:hypothetical protein
MKVHSAVDVPDDDYDEDVERKYARRGEGRNCTMSTCPGPQLLCWRPCI